MQYRRCQTLFLEPRETPGFRLQDLLAGGTGLHYEQGVVAMAPHLDRPVPITPDEAGLLLACSAETWQPLPTSAEARARVTRLLAEGVLVSDSADHAVHADADTTLRASHWWSVAALFHRLSRWTGVDSVEEMERSQMVTAQDLVRKLGNPPAEAPPRLPGAVALPPLGDRFLDGLLLRRTTCRNFDTSRPLPLALLAGMLGEVLLASAHVEPEPGVRFLKKNVASAGGLHPIEAYVLVQNVEGLEPGLHHYHAVAHELARLPVQPPALPAFAHQLLAGQSWFADAHALVILICRFERNFWKYRNHAKAYRAVTLDAGHISHAFYTQATAYGLGAFVTAAINEEEVEQVLGLDPMREGPLAVCGFGWRSEQMRTPEMDPAGHTWKTGP